MHAPCCSCNRCLRSLLRSFKSVVVAVRAVVTIVMTLLFRVVYGFTALVYQYVPWNHWLFGVGKQASRTIVFRG